MFARLLGLRLCGGPEAVLLLVDVAEASVCAGLMGSAGGGRERVWTWEGETGVEGPFEPSAEDWGDWGDGEEEVGG